MTQTPPPLNPAELVFERKVSGKDNPVLYLIGGIAAMAFAVMGFMTAMVSNVSALRLQCMTTVPILLGGGALVTAWRLSRTPTKVVLGTESLRVETRGASREWNWEQIGWCTVSTMTYTQRRQLVLFDTAGKSLIKIGDSLNAFDMLVDRVKLMVTATNADTAEALRMRKAKRSSVFMFVTSLFLLSIAIANVYIAREEQRTKRLLNEAAVTGQGVVEELRIAPNGVTRRLIYRVTSPDGKAATHNAQVTPDYWDSQQVGATVPVVYVPAEPSITRLATGEIVSNNIADSPMVTYGLCAVIATMCMFFLAGAYLQWTGWNIDFDSKTHKFSIKRFGTGQ